MSLLGAGELQHVNTPQIYYFPGFLVNAIYSLASVLADHDTIPCLCTDPISRLRHEQGCSIVVFNCKHDGGKV